VLLAAAKKAENALRRCGASTGHITKLKQSIFFRDLWVETTDIIPLLAENIHHSKKQHWQPTHPFSIKNRW